MYKEPSARSKCIARSIETLVLYMPLAFLAALLFILLREGPVQDSVVSQRVRETLNIPVKSRFLAEISLDRFHQKLDQLNEQSQGEPPRSPKQNRYQLAHGRKQAANPGSRSIFSDLTPYKSVF